MRMYYELLWERAWRHVLWRTWWHDETRMRPVFLSPSFLLPSSSCFSALFCFCFLFVLLVNNMFVQASNFQAFFSVCFLLFCFCFSMFSLPSSFFSSLLQTPHQEDESIREGKGDTHEDTLLIEKEMLKLRIQTCEKNRDTESLEGKAWGIYIETWEKASLVLSVKIQPHIRLVGYFVVRRN